MMMHIAVLPGGLSGITATLCWTVCKPIACSLLLEHLHSTSGFDTHFSSWLLGKTSNPVLFPYLFRGDDNSFPTINQCLEPPAFGGECQDDVTQRPQGNTATQVRNSISSAWVPLLFSEVGSAMGICALSSSAAAPKEYARRKMQQVLSCANTVCSHGVARWARGTVSGYRVFLLPPLCCTCLLS